MNQKSVSTITIDVPTGVKVLAEEEAAEFGVSVKDLMGLLISSHFIKSRSRISTGRKYYLKALKDVKQKKYTEVNSQEELDVFLSSLSCKK